MLVHREPVNLLRCPPEVNGVVEQIFVEFRLDLRNLGPCPRDVF